MSSVAFMGGRQAAAKPAPTLAAYALLRLRGAYVEKLDRKLPNGEAVALWVREMDLHLARCGITREQVDQAMLRAVAECEWPPLEVPVFLRLCLGVPDLEDAFREVQRFAYARQLGEQMVGADGKPRPLSHPALYWAGDRMGWERVRNSSFSRETAAVWGRCVAEVMSWGEWPEPAPLRLTDERRLRTRGAHVSAMAEARRILAERGAA